MPVLDFIPKKKPKAPRVFTPPPATFRHYEPPLVPGPHPVPARLAQKLRALSRRYVFFHAGERLARIVIVAILLLSAQMLLDWLFDLPLFVRILLLIGDLVLFGFYVRRYLLPLILHPPDRVACALMVEKKWRKFQGRVIAAVQLADQQINPNSADLVYALQQETEARVISTNFGQIVPAKPVLRRIGTAFIVVALWGALMFFAAPGSIFLLQRVFLIPVKVPRKTEVICLSGNKIVPAGDSVLLEAQARGIVPSHGLVTMTYDSGRIQEVTLDPEPDHSDRFSLKIDSMTESMHYVIRLNDGISDTYEVKIVPRPGLTSIECEQIYPAYTGLPNMKRMVGNLALLAGSQLKIHAVANGQLTKATLKLVGTGQLVPINIDPADGKTLTGQIKIPISGITGFSIELTNLAGITSGGETQYPIDIIPDRPPTIELTYPDQIEELFTLKAKPTIGFHATDDYGLAKIFLCYRPVTEDTSSNVDANGNPPPPPEPKRIEMDLGSDKPLDMQRRYELDLSSLKPAVTEGTTIEYWMEARDANDVNGPGIGESEHHTIKVVSEMEKKEEIMRRLMESLSATEDILNTEQKTNQSLGQIIQGKTDQSTDQQ
ncbi:MAG: DUF4175 domain-containing protein [Methylacidiphilales bacterium]|nr:DUF4175 domain-containing protein [Candidatus Methylacidiphilales bacterium]